jgi:microcystin synthetase protein McyA
MVNHFATLLESITAGPQEKIANLAVMTEAERQQIVSEWNDTASPYPSVCLHKLFEQQAARSPEATAVVFKDEYLTYRELDGRANQLAWHLRAAGVGPEVLVGIYVERSIEMVVGLLGVLKAGGAYVPLDPTYPQERLRFMMTDSRITVLLTQNHLAPNAPASAARIICLDSDWAQIADHPAIPAPSGVIPANLAYVIYTSGSSGKPKGVMIAHHAITNQMLWVQEQFKLNESDKVLLKTPFSFDASVKEFFAALVSGARLMVSEPGGHHDSSYLIKTIMDQQITVLQVVPSLLQTLVDQSDFNLCSSLRWIWCAGEELSPKLRARCFEVSCAELYNLYGPTEAAIDVSFWHCAREDERPRVPIGRAIKNIELYILDKSLQPQPVGVAGDLFIGGHGLGRGYLDRSDLTAQRFVPDPFSGRHGARLYWTGDSARLTEDGVIEYLGRTDNQIKIRGCRTELGEVEAAIRSHNAVRACVVVPVGKGQNLDLVTYIEANSADCEFAARSQSYETEMVGSWQLMYDELYASPSSDVTLNTVGWISSYTGLPFSSGEMQEWLDGTIEAIRTLNPKRVLEIGAGTGLLVARLAPDCEQYVAADFSLAAVENLKRLRLSQPDLAHIEIQYRKADEFTELAPGSFDTVILNSVVQYFPSIEYLQKVLHQALRLMQPGGALFIGDVRSLPLLDVFHLSLLLPKVQPQTTVGEIRQQLAFNTSAEKELVIDPNAFHSLQQSSPDVAEIQVELKRGRHHNELTKYRYDVVIRVGTSKRCTNVLRRLDWTWSHMSLELLRNELASTPDKSLLITGVPNARLHPEIETLRLITGASASTNLETLLQTASISRVNTVNPSDLIDICNGLPFNVHLSWSQSGPIGSIDAAFISSMADSRPDQFEVCASHHSQLPLANAPLRSRISEWLVPEIRERLRNTVPNYMVPASFVILDQLPLMPNGKLDREALPLMAARHRSSNRAFAAPGSEEEMTIACIWKDVLDLDTVSVEDNFFDVGGHSLKLIAVKNRIFEAFGRSLSIVDLFQHPTVRALATLLSTASNSATPATYAQPRGVERRSRMSMRQDIRIARSKSRERDSKGGKP